MFYGSSYFIEVWTSVCCCVKCCLTLELEYICHPYPGSTLLAPFPNRQQACRHTLVKTPGREGQRCSVHDNFNCVWKLLAYPSILLSNGRHLLQGFSSFRALCHFWLIFLQLWRQDGVSFRGFPSWPCSWPTWLQCCRTWGLLIRR